MAEKKVSRRTFIKGAALAGVSLSTIGVGAANAYPVKIPKKWDRRTDVIIVGSGVAGLSAAIALQEANVKALIIEKMSSPFFSSSSMCAGVAKVSSAAKIAQGKSELQLNMYDKLMAFGEYANIPELLRAYVDNSGPTIDRLIELGLKPLTAYPSNGVNVAFGNGMNIIKPMIKIIEEKKTPFLFDTRVIRLVTDTSGKVLGVEAQSKKGKLNIKANKGVILATGGFAADMELFDRELVTAKGAYWGVSPTHTGDGFRMASRIGADTTHMAFSGTYNGGFPISGQSGERHALLLLLMDDGIYLNINGDRFVDETIGHCPVGVAELKQPEKRMVIIMDQIIFEQWLEKNKTIPVVTGWSNERIIQEAEKGFYIKRADTIKEVAEKAGLPVNKVEETINKYNGYVENKKDLDFGRKELKYKIEKPPFYAMPVKPIIMQVLGGLRIDPKARVLDAYDKPVPGLYAAGEVVGGIMGTMYDGGSCIGSGLTFGRIAGKSAASAT